MKLWITHSVSNVPRTIRKRMKKKMTMKLMPIKKKSVQELRASVEMTKMEKATP